MRRVEMHRMILIGIAGTCLMIVGCAPRGGPGPKGLWVFVSDKELPRKNYATIERDHTAVYLLDFATKKDRRIDTIGHKASAVFSPDGKRVAYFAREMVTVTHLSDGSTESQPGPSVVRVYNIKTDISHSYPAPEALAFHCWGLSWLPDGRSLVYATKTKKSGYPLASSG